MKAFITGGTGFIGRRIVRELLRKGHGVTVLSRSGRGFGQRGVEVIRGDPVVPGEWQEKVLGHELIINLAGSSIFQRWSDENKRAIRDSRILTTRNLVQALKSAKEPVTFFSTSAVGYYGFHGHEILDEDSLPGDDFLARLAVDWEAEASKAEEFGHRVVITRFGIVLGRDGGALAMMARPFRYFMGAVIGHGSQFVSWIHERDLVEGLLFLTEAEAKGPINLTSPNPVTNRELMNAIASVLKRPIILPNIPGFFLRLFFGEFATVLLNGQRVVPKRLLEMGFRFSFPKVEDAIWEILGNGRR